MTDTLTNQDCFDLQTDLRQDARFQPHYNELVDVRHLARSEVTGDALVQLARNSSHEQGSKRAIVVGNDTDYGLSRLFRMLNEHNPEVTEIFWAINEARNWLGLPPGEDE
jgi:hypothetical protein